MNLAVFKTGRTQLLLHICAVVLVTVVSFSPVLKGGFIGIDDAVMVYNNEKIMGLTTENVVRYFTTIHRGLYHPLVLLSYALEFKLLQLDPAIYHATNLLFHVANALLVYFLFLLLTRRSAAALLVALLFAVHPLHVESVAWITERKDVLYAFFFLLSCLSYVLFVREKRCVYYYVALATFLLSLLSKAMAVTLPAVLLLFDHMLTGKIDKKDMLNKIPFVVLSIIFAVIAMSGQKSFSHHEALSMVGILRNGLEANYNILLYLSKMIYPARLSLIYPKYLDAGNTLGHTLLYSPIATLFLALLVIISLRRTRKVLYGFIFFIVTLSPVVNFVPFALGTPGDRYTYIPLLGIFYILAEAVAWLYENSIIDTKLWRRVFAGILCLLISMLAGATYQRCTLWKNSFRLFTRVIADYGDSRNSKFAYSIIARIYVRNHEDDRGMAYIQKALTLDNEYYNGYYTRGAIYLLRGDRTRAMEDFRKAIVLIPTRGPEPYIALAENVVAGGKYLAALAYCRAYLVSGGDMCSSIFRARGEIYLKMHDYPKALADCLRAIELNPYDHNTYALRGRIYELQHDFEKSRADRARAVELYSMSPNIRVQTRQYASLEEELWEENDIVENW